MRRIVRHNVTNIRFTEMTPQQAEVACYFTVFTEIGLDHYGRYRDLFVPVGDHWLIQHRFVSTDWHAPELDDGGLGLAIRLAAPASTAMSCPAGCARSACVYAPAVGADVVAGRRVVGRDATGGGWRGRPVGLVKAGRRHPYPRVAAAAGPGPGAYCGTPWPDSVALGSPFQL